MFRKIFFFYLILTISLSGFAAPEFNEAEDWLRRVKIYFDLSSNDDLREMYKAKLSGALSALKISPHSRNLKRDAGDAYHGLGHLFDYDQDFSNALEFHSKSLQYYREADLPTRSSWDNGVEHAIEHIFLVHYEVGLFLDRANRKSEARENFKKAWDLVEQNSDFLQDNIWQDGRIGQRYFDLQSKLRSLENECGTALKPRGNLTPDTGS